MANPFLLILMAILIILLGWTLIRRRKDTYVSSVVIESPFDVVWSWISDPSRYDRLYPHWVKKVTSKSNQVFQVEDQFGGVYDLALSQHKEWGIVDLQIGEESSCSHVYRIDKRRTMVIHLAKRWKGAYLWVWLFHQWTTDRDLRHAKRLLEGIH